MSWLEKLCETYECCKSQVGKVGAIGFRGKKRACLLPLYHTTRQAAIEITLNVHGEFRRARALGKEESFTIIPCTEESEGRSRGPVPHPLSDSLKYIEGEHFALYLGQLAQWCTSSAMHPKVTAVYHYVQKGSVSQDLLAVGLSVEADPVIRWTVEIDGNPQSALHSDPEIWESWQKYYGTTMQKEQGLCYVTGETATLRANHPRFLRNAGDRAKLISANDNDGFTYRGKFSKPQQACSVGFDASHKAHSALRWLIAKQGYQDGDLAIVAWSTSGNSVPDPLADSRALLGLQDEEQIAYAGEDYALRLQQKMQGYTADLGSARDIVVLGLDSATKGRMSLIFYKELSGSEFLERIEEWHTDCCWSFVGTPAPKKIAEAIYGENAKDMHKKTVCLLLPCIIDRKPLPQYLVKLLLHRASHRERIQKKDREMVLNIACAILRKDYKTKRRIYSMSLELDCTSRDYLYGRLLAVAELIERSAYAKTEEARATSAEKYMHSFANDPCGTWLKIYKALRPYRDRLRANKPGWFITLDKEMQAIMETFDREDFISNKKLSGEFLLGYSCQKNAFKKNKKEETVCEP